MLCKTSILFYMIQLIANWLEILIQTQKLIFIIFFCIVIHHGVMDHIINYDVIVSVF